MIEVRPGVVQDSIDAIMESPRAAERAFLAAGVSPVRARDVVAGGTLFVDGKPQTVAGVVGMQDGIGLAWLLSRVELKPYVRQVYGALRVGIKQAEARGWKLVAKVQSDDPAAVLLIEHLGFTPLAAPDSYGFRLYGRKAR